MYFDSLTIAGLAVASVTAILPLFFGREMIRVHEDDTRGSLTSPRRPEAGEAVAGDIECPTAPEVCR